MMEQWRKVGHLIITAALASAFLANDQLKEIKVSLFSVFMIGAAALFCALAIVLTLRVMKRGSASIRGVLPMAGGVAIAISAIASLLSFRSGAIAHFPMIVALIILVMINIKNIKLWLLKFFCKVMDVRKDP